MNPLAPFLPGLHAPRSHALTLRRSPLHGVLAALLLFAGAAQAYPPAPSHTLFGCVRDQYGTPLAVAGTQILLQTPTGVTLATALTPGVGPGVNFQMKVPMDAGTAPDPYQATALWSATPYKMLVVIGGTTNLPIQMTGNFAALGKPGGQTRVDLTLGVDANGDGIPDAWEQAIIAALGLNLTLNDLNANLDLFGDGRTLMQEFLMGNALFDPADSFTLTLVDYNGGSPILEFTSMTGRSYAVLGSTDLRQWNSLSFVVSGDPTGASRSFLYTPGISTVRLQVPLTAGAPMTFFRLVMQ